MDKDYEYDVAISFAEEDRNIAQILALSLEIKQVNAFFYPDCRSDVVGHEISEKLAKIYSNEARYAVILFSAHYFNPDKQYVKIELDAIRERMKVDSTIVYLMPIKLNSDISLEAYPDLANLGYLDWNNNPKEIADILAQNLGKEIGNNAEKQFIDNSTNEDNSIVSYIGTVTDSNFSGAIIEGNATNVQGDQIYSTSAGGNVISTQDGDITVEGDTFYTPPKETKFVCPFCLNEQEHKHYGKNVCDVCNSTFIVPSPILVQIYPTLDPNEAKEYNKIRAHINNKIRDKNYAEAYKYCLKAEELAPGEVSTWEHFALTEFLLEINKDRNTRKSTIDIVKSIRIHIEKCRDYEISDEKYEELVVDIANRLFYLERSRIKSVKAAYMDELGNERWTKQNLYFLQPLLKSFEICYGLYNNTIFLEEYVKELVKPYKWLIKTVEGDIINTPACGGFNALFKLKYLVNKIKEKKPDYSYPEIAKQRFILVSTEVYDKPEGTNIPDIDIDNTNPDPNYFQIISID